MKLVMMATACCGCSSMISEALKRDENGTMLMTPC